MTQQDGCQGITLSSYPQGCVYYTAALALHHRQSTSSNRIIEHSFSTPRMDSNSVIHLRPSSSWGMGLVSGVSLHSSMGLVTLRGRGCRFRNEVIVIVCSLHGGNLIMMITAM